MREGSLEAPTRHPVAWQDEAFYDEVNLDTELRRVFDICHSCRRCFNLCDSFPRLFDLIDDSTSGELDNVASSAFKSVVDACTLCDMCFMTKCPYVPPHEFQLDFPHLMLRYRAVEHRKGAVPASARAIKEIDRNGRLAAPIAGLANWVIDERNEVTRPVLQKIAKIHREARLPRFVGKTFVMRARDDRAFIDITAPAYGRKAVLYATCTVNYHLPSVGAATRKVLAANGVETEVVYPGCCGMPQHEHGDLAKVAEAAVRVAEAMAPWIDRGYPVVALVPSCALMLKFEWPLIVPRDWPAYPLVDKLARATVDVSEYVVDLARTAGLAPGLKPLDGPVALHSACHARAQNMGQKAAEMLRLVPELELKVIERCSGHGGSFGVMQDFFEVAHKVGKPVVRQALASGAPYVVSECPLAGLHIAQGMERQTDRESETPPQAGSRGAGLHPIELIARAYGLDET